MLSLLWMFNLLQTGNNENFQRKDCCYQSMTLKVEKLFASLNMFISLYTLTMQKTVSKKKKKVNDINDIKTEQYCIVKLVLQELENVYDLKLFK